MLADVAAAIGVYCAALATLAFCAWYLWMENK